MFDSFGWGLSPKQHHGISSCSISLNFGWELAKTMGLMQLAVFAENIYELAFHCARCAPSNLGKIVFHLWGSVLQSKNNNFRQLFKIKKKHLLGTFCKAKITRLMWDAQLRFIYIFCVLLPRKEGNWQTRGVREDWRPRTGSAETLA